jgi:hypothetical protein
MKIGLVAGAGAMAAAALCAQSVVTARAGLIHYIEGTVILDGQRLELRASEFKEAGLNQLLHTGDGRAEVLLSPGSVLRLGSHSAMRMLANRLEETRIALLNGRALIEIDQLLENAYVGITIRGHQVRLLKRGLYHFNADTGEFRVYDGKAQLTSDGKILNLTRGRRMVFDKAPVIAKFKTKERDDLYLWSQQRSLAMLLDNYSAARSLDPKIKLSGNSWYYVSRTGMYTFLPSRGTVSSPFGWTWYSPRTIWIVYAPRAYSGYDSGGESSTWRGISSVGGNAAAEAAPEAGVAIRSAPVESAPAAPTEGRGR